MCGRTAMGPRGRTVSKCRACFSCFSKAGVIQNNTPPPTSSVLPRHRVSHTAKSDIQTAESCSQGLCGRLKGARHHASGKRGPADRRPAPSLSPRAVAGGRWRGMLSPRGGWKSLRSGPRKGRGDGCCAVLCHRPSRHILKSPGCCQGSLSGSGKRTGKCRPSPT